jgi:hypothetical protein
LDSKNFDFVLHTVFKVANCDILQGLCLKSICTNPRPFFTSKDFLSLDENILYRLLERNDLQIDEIDVWDYLIKWGIEQTPGLGNDITKWSNEDYESLKETLHQYIPLIRLVDFKPIEYFDKIQPYKAIIPNHIYDEIEEFYIKGTLPKATSLLSRKEKIISNIIKPKFIPEIINWIEESNNNYLSCRFDLIYQGSRDGISNESFRNKCNLQEPILVLIKCKNSEKIFGGYTPVGFYHPKEGHVIFSTGSFIFYSNEDYSGQNMAFKYHVRNYEHAVFNNFHNDRAGFSFGNGDICMRENELLIHTGFHRVYNTDLPAGSYTIEEIEAFKVVER